MVEALDLFSVAGILIIFVCVSGIWLSPGIFGITVREKTAFQAYPAHIARLTRAVSVPAVRMSLFNLTPDRVTVNVKNSFIRGFIVGLQRKWVMATLNLQNTTATEFTAGDVTAWTRVLHATWHSPGSGFRAVHKSLVSRRIDPWLTTGRQRLGFHVSHLICVPFARTALVASHGTWMRRARVTVVGLWWAGNSGSKKN